MFVLRDSLTMAEAPEQCVILVGGLGTRLGALTTSRPKPLLQVGDGPFLDELIWQAKRFGFRRISLLAGFHAEMVVEYLESRPFDPSVNIEVIVEPEPKGTAGALRFAAGRLAPQFFLINGDSIFDFNWLDLVPFCAEKQDWLVGMALRPEADTSRYGLVNCNASRVIGFSERGGPTSGVINGGVYLVSGNILDILPERGSLERDVLPSLARQGQVYGQVYDGFFIDIGTPESFAAAGELLGRNKRRPALFLSRNDVLNVDHNCIGRIEDFKLNVGAIDAVKLANDRGFYVFLTSSQADIAQGYYGNEQVDILACYAQRKLRAFGAHLDDFRSFSSNADGRPPSYSPERDWQKAEPRMILDLMKHWPIDQKNSILIGSTPDDMLTAERAGIRGLLLGGANLAQFTAQALAGDPLPNTDSHVEINDEFGGHGKNST
jgi:dTDP-glucose pyrophosphorylase